MDRNTVHQQDSEDSVNSQRYSQDENLPRTTRRQGTKGDLGILYEKKIIMIALYRAIKEKYDFTLDTNVEGFGAFDDAIFKYKDDHGIEQHIYLQAKHKENENQKIEYDDLFLLKNKNKNSYSYKNKNKKNKNYCLYKYFIDFIKIEKKFRSSAEKVSKYFVIYTNIDLSYSEADGKGKRIHKNNTETEHLIFKKLDLSYGNPLTIFSTAACYSENDKKSPAFYQFSNIETNDYDKIYQVLKNKFVDINMKAKELRIDELTSNLQNFITKLVFAVDQLNENDLSSQIKGEMKHTSKDSQDEIDFIHEYALRKIGDWKNRNNVMPLTEKNDYFKEAKEKINQKVLLYPSLVNGNKLNNSSIRFSKIKYQQLEGFISSGKQLWPISSEASWLNSLFIFQALRNDTCVTHFGNIDRHFLLYWHDLSMGYNLLLPAFKAMETSLLIIVCKTEDHVDLSQLSEIINEIVSIVCTPDSRVEKKIIVIAPKNHELLMRLKEKLDIYNESGKIVFGDLFEKLQETILVEKKIRFQGKNELFSIQELLDQREGDNVKEVLAEFPESELEKLLKSFPVEIGNECPQLSHFELAHLKQNKAIELEQLKQALVANRSDIFAFVGRENEIKELLPTKSQGALVQFEDSLSSVNGSYFRLKDGEEVEQFKKLCQITYQVLIESGVKTNESKPVLHLVQQKRGTWIWLRTYSQSFYMDRYLYLIMVNKDLLLKNFLLQRNNDYLSDFIVFSGINEDVLLNLFKIDSNEDKDHFKKRAAVFLEESDAETKFESLCKDEIAQKMSIHWLQVNLEENQVQLQWYRSVGKMDRIRNLQQKSRSISEKDLTDSKKRFIVLADEPGVGKSITLTHIPDYMKKRNPSLWIMKFDLNRYQKVLASTQVKTVEELVNLLSNIDTNLKDPLTRRILLYKLMVPMQVALLWDGFDEIDLDRQKAVLALFDFLKKKTASIIWVTTRKRHGQRQLEECLSVLAYPFVSLKEEEQIDLLSRFWIVTSKLTGKTPESSALRSFARDVIQRFETSIKGDGFFISIPLRVRMMAEIYEEEVERMLERGESFSEFFKTNEKLWITDLYEQFLSKKYDIYLRDKVAIEDGLDEESRKYLIRGYTKAYEFLAIKGLFGEERTEPLMSPKKQHFSLNTLSRIGVIQGSEEPVLFIHKTFAEYFAGKWLSEHASLPNVKEFLGTQILTQNSGVIRSFFDQYFTKNLPLHRAVLKNDTSEVQKLLIANSDKQTDGLDRTALHLAAQEGMHHLIECFCVTDAVKEVDHFLRLPLHYAAYFGHDETINELLKNVTDIDLYDHILRRPLHFSKETGNCIFNDEILKNSKLWELVNKQDTFGKSALDLAADNGHWNVAFSLMLHGADSGILTEEHKISLYEFANRETYGAYGNRKHRLCTIVGYLSFQLSETVKKYSDDRLLPYFFTNGHTKVIHALLVNKPDAQTRENFANQNYNNKNPLQYFMENNVFSGADHLNIIKYFFTQGIQQGLKIDSLAKNRLLHNAAKEDYLDSVKYLLQNEGLDMKKASDRVKVNRFSDNFAVALTVYNLHDTSREEVDSFFRNCTVADSAIMGNNSLAVLKYLMETHGMSVENDSTRTPLHAAAFSGNLQACRYLCENGANVDAKDNFSQTTPLHLADRDAMLYLIKYLIERRAELNICDKENNTALDRAVKNKQWQIVKYLIEKQALGNKNLLTTIKSFFENSSQSDLLHSAIISQDIDLVQFLLQHKVDVNNRDKEGRTPLHCAAKFVNRKDQDEVIRWLLQRGAQYDAVDRNQKTALNLLNIRNNSEPCDKSIRLLYLIDCLFNSHSLMKDLIKNEICSEEQVTIEDLCGVCYFQSISLYDANLNLIRNTDIPMRFIQPYDMNNPRTIPSGYFINTIQKNPIRIFLNTQSVKKGNLLHVAAGQHDIRALIFLLKFFDNEYLFLKHQNFDHIPDYQNYINVEDEQGNTPLNIAAQREDHEKVVLLLKNGAIFKTKTQTIAEYLRPIENLFDQFKLNCVLDVTTELQKASLYAKDDEGKTLLHWAISKGNIDAVRKLLDLGLDIDALDNQRNSPLHEAAKKDQTEIIRLLLQRGARFNVENMKGQTPLNLSKLNFLPRIEELFNFLRSNSPEEVILKKLQCFGSASESDLLTVIEVRDKQSCTLLHWASRENYVAIVKQLLQWGAIYDIPDKTVRTTSYRFSYYYNREIRDLFQLIEEWMYEGKKTGFSTDKMQSNTIRFSTNEIKEDPIKVTIIKKARNHLGETPLHINTNCFRLKFLLDEGADLTTQDLNGNTPLHRAVERGDTAVVKLFLDRNANVNAKNKNNQRPIDLSKKEIITFLLQKYEG